MMKAGGVVGGHDSAIASLFGRKPIVEWGILLFLIVSVSRDLRWVQQCCFSESSIGSVVFQGRSFKLENQSKKPPLPTWNKINFSPSSSLFSCLHVLSSSYRYNHGLTLTDDFLLDRQRYLLRYMSMLSNSDSSPA